MTDKFKTCACCTKFYSCTKRAKITLREVISGGVNVRNIELAKDCDDYVIDIGGLVMEWLVDNSFFDKEELG